MNHFRYLAAVSILFPIIALADKPGDKELNETEEKFIEKLVDVSLAHADLVSKRYAFVGVGESTKIKNGVIERDHLRTFRTGAGDPEEKVKYLAAAYRHSSGMFWKQRLDHKGDRYGRMNPTSKGRKFTVEEKSQSKLMGIAPIIQSVCLSGALTYKTTQRDIIDFLVTGSNTELVNASSKAGNLHGKWRISHPGYHVDINIELSENSGFMPTRTTWHLVLSEKKERRLLSELRTKWRKQNGMFLPCKMIGVDFASAGGSNEYHIEMDFEWLVGDELPRKFKLRPDDVDWRSHFVEAFGKNWQDWSVDTK